ncbi:MAG: SPASM domain-containing protein, partial [bacterium]
PEFPAMVRYASERDIKTVATTNSQLLHDEAYEEEILKSGLTTLVVAIDSLYEDNALFRLRKLVALKRQLDSKTLINMRMVITKHNEHELKKMRKIAKELGVNMFTVKAISPIYNSNCTDQEIVPDNPEYRRYVYRKGTYERIRIDERCRRIWETITILSNGDVVPCCYDYNSEMKVGNIREQPLSEIWASPAYRELRKRIYYQKDSIPKCRECYGSFKKTRSGWIVESIDFNDNIKARFVNRFSRYISKLKVQTI